ncbi:MAG: hypothetical protein M1274_02470, partial [Actinobacteria bacterium]|nr:hypothetical protein [Actinomycetota bacterium]
DEGNEDQMAEGMIRILSNRRLAKKMGKRSREIAESHSIGKTLTTYEALYLSLVSKEDDRSLARSFGR